MDLGRGTLLKEVFGKKGSHGGQCVLRKADIEKAWWNVEVSQALRLFSQKVRDEQVALGPTFSLSSRLDF